MSFISNNRRMFLLFVSTQATFQRKTNGYFGTLGGGLKACDDNMDFEQKTFFAQTRTLKQYESGFLLDELNRFVVWFIANVKTATVTVSNVYAMGPKQR